MTKSLRIAVALAATGLIAAAAPAADAATRYASPNGSSSDCTASKPCKLRDAVRDAKSGDTVIVAGGTYDVDHGLKAPGVLYIRPAAGASRPVLVGEDKLGEDTLSLPSGGTVDGLRIETHSPGKVALSMTGGTATDVFAMSCDTATNATAISLTGTSAGTTLRNSVAWARASGAAALELKGTLGTVTVSGVTAWGLAGTNGVTARDLSVKTIRNSILHGGTYDVQTAGGVGPIVSSSNYRSAKSTGLSVGLLNQETTPRLADVANGDFNELSGSATIDAGVADDLLAGLGFGGLARVGLPDIGALDFGAAVTVPVADPGTAGSDSSGPGDSGSDSNDAPSTGQDASSSGGAPTTTPPPATQPEIGQTVNLEDVKGTPTVRLPGSNAFIPVTAETTIPVGSVVDATNGQVALTSVRDEQGRTDTGRFWGTRFKVTQAGGYTDLKIASKPSCAAHAKRKASSSQRLWGSDDHGRFRTRGRHGSATVRGTRWLTEDRCNGTYFKVKKGVVDIRNRNGRKVATLRRGQSKLVRR